MRIMTLAEADVAPELRRQVVRLRRQAWPGLGGKAEGTWHDPELAPLSMLLIEGEHVLAALDILSKEIEHRRHTCAASGLSTVVTEQSARRMGHGRRLVEAARERLATSGADLGIF